jgi:hypothetical protein
MVGMANAHISATFAAKVVRVFASGANSAGPRNFACEIVLSIWLLLCEEAPHASGGVAFREESALRRGDDCPDEKDLCPVREAFL